MFPLDIWLTYTLACLLLVISPGPDNLLAVSRGLSQGKRAASISGLASGAGILFHVLAASLGLTVLILSSPLTFFAVKLLGACYLIWLGIKILRNKNLISLSPTQKTPHRAIFTTGFLSAVLNPKPGLFVLAFVPQFIDPTLGSVALQMLLYGTWFALLTAFGFALMGIFASRIASWLIAKPIVADRLNLGAGATFVASGVAIINLES